MNQGRCYYFHETRDSEDLLNDPRAFLGRIDTEPGTTPTGFYTFPGRDNDSFGSVESVNKLQRTQNKKKGDIQEFVALGVLSEVI